MIENIDFFYTNPGQFEELRCSACNSICNVERNRPGPSFGTLYWKLSQGQKSDEQDKHDRFICPHAYENWHVKATILKRDIAMSNSPSLQDIMQKDLEQIVDTNIGECVDSSATLKT